MGEQAGDTVRIGALELTFLVDEHASGGKAVMFEMVVPADARVPAPHYHREVDEVVYGLDGTLTMDVGGIAHEVTRGDAVFIPRGAVHGFRNPHGAPARVLSVLTPGSIGRAYFEEVAEVVKAGGPPDLARVKEIMQRHGLVPV